MCIGKNLDPYGEEVMSRRSRQAARRRRYRKHHYKESLPTASTVSESEQLNQQELPVCSCGRVVKYAGVHVCEDCFVHMQVRWPGKVTRVKINL